MKAESPPKFEAEHEAQHVLVRATVFGHAFVETIAASDLQRGVAYHARKEGPGWRLYAEDAHLIGRLGPKVTRLVNRLVRALSRLPIPHTEPECKVTVIARHAKGRHRINCKVTIDVRHKKAPGEDRELVRGAIRGWCEAFVANPAFLVDLDGLGGPQTCTDTRKPS